jgi:hypothetical protein
MHLSLLTPCLPETDDLINYQMHTNKVIVLGLVVMALE